MPENNDVLLSPDVQVDLTNCDREPIHIPGRVQSHGFLLAVHMVTKTVSYASDNLEQFTGASVNDILNKTLGHFLQVAKIDTGYTDLLRLIDTIATVDFEAINPISVSLGDQKFNLIVHPSTRFLLFEFEPQNIATDRELQQLVGLSLSRILEANTLEHMLAYTAKQVKDIIEYDRVMVYKFWEDDHGEVVAEEKNEGLEQFMGLHYPASDIPKQARELYKMNLVRIIADVNATPASLVVTDPHYSEEPLDLTYSTLRAVSPIHIEYLKNMAVAASFSISIVVKDKLWGLIACHNYAPKFIDFKARTTAKLIGKILSSSLEYREEQERKITGRSFELALQKIISLAARDWNIVDSLVSTNDNILKLTHAPGAALLFENQLYTLGDTPAENEIQDIIKWLKISNQPTLFHTDNLSQLLPTAQAYKHVASGLLSCTLSKELHEYILWFKPEFKKTVSWAGNPEKSTKVDEDGQARLSPRRSFAVWSQEVEATSMPWASAEVGCVMKLREEILQLINQKANQIRRLNEELQKAYDELDTFSFTISHDLKTPLATIKNYTEILMEDYTDLPDDVKEILGKVVKNADRMNLLIKEVLSYSRIDRQEMNFVELDMATIIPNIVYDIKTAFNANNTEVVVGNTPSVKGDDTMIYQVFTNIIANAVKYSAKSAKPRVEIEGKETAGEIIYRIADNGIGIDMTYGNQVFVLFKRLENARKYEGTGVGLAIVKRILEKHKAKIWYESRPEGGTVFYLSFRKQANYEAKS